MLVTGVPHPYGLTVGGDYIYWTDWTTKAIHRADKDTGQNNIIVKGKLQALRDIHAVQLEQASGKPLLSCWKAEYLPVLSLISNIYLQVTILFYHNNDDDDDDTIRTHLNILHI